MSIFQQATRLKLRFNSPIGALSTEQLWDLPLIKRTTQAGTDLDTVGRQIKRELKTMEEDSVVKTKPDPRRDVLSLQLAVVVAIVETKQSEAEAAEKRAVKAAERKKLTEALAAADDQALSKLSRDEILKKLSDLED